MRHQPDDVEMQAHRRAAPDPLGPLFDEAPATPIATTPRVFPTARPVIGAEQRGLHLPGSIDAEYTAWRASDVGTTTYLAIRKRALAKADAGAARISAKGLVEWAREEFQRTINNDFTACIARELRTTLPRLKPLIELRPRPSEAA